jgi:outer membrane lipoprotein carrier protein
MKSILHGVGALLVLLAPIAWAGEAELRLDRFLSGLSTLRAEFKQTVLDPQSAGEESSGELLISRPGKFRLQYDKPYEQLYVADGKRVWLYDKDLAQVTVKNQKAALGSTPALLLSSTEPLTNSFKLSEAGEREGLAWVELKPLAEESSFESVSLGLGDGTLKVMEMLDGLGQRTRIEFVRMERNVKIDPTKFRFSPPEGVDVIGE